MGLLRQGLVSYARLLKSLVMLVQTAGGGVGKTQQGSGVIPHHFDSQNKRKR
jgi:hypothetical protein